MKKIDSKNSWNHSVIGKFENWQNYVSVNLEIRSFKKKLTRSKVTHKEGIKQIYYYKHLMCVATQNAYDFAGSFANLYIFMRHPVQTLTAI